jgi:uncharacterized protein (TIGR02271 family)
MREPTSRCGTGQTVAPNDSSSSNRDKETRGPSSDNSQAKQETLRFSARQLSVEPRRVETARVRVDVVTHEHHEVLSVPLAREQAVVERVPIDRQIGAIPAIREDGDTIIVPVVEEVVVVECGLMLKEEPHIRRVRTTEQRRESHVAAPGG